ncbi:MAG: UDP-2,3-diacylglucosamine diphosphatase, partial [Acidobacteriota bacterium]|nr:UDP-2,3-diacylglucosamine diphosphatase [Acidobacteriota bacterium]
MESLGRAVFISDCHLGSGPPDADRARHARLQHFLEVEGPRSDTLFLLGDLFDFWIEYRHAIPNQHFEILRRLRTLRERGLRIVYVGGNHDYWAGPFLSEVIGCEVRRAPFEETVQGRRLFLAHGDGLRASERGYRFMRSILRAGWFGVLYRSLHPDWGIPLARALSRTSRSTNDESRVSIPDLRREIAEPRFTAGVDAVVIGHYHHPTHLRQNGKEFL